MQRWQLSLLKRLKRMSSSEFLTTNQLAKRWGLHPDTLMRWRKADKGPPYFVTPSSVLYSTAEVEQYEKANTHFPED